MKLFRLRSFVAVAETQKSVDAAKKLEITPAAISQHINDLEAEMRVDLFERKRSGMQLTPKGRLLVSHAIDVLESVHVLEKKAAVIEEDVFDTLRIGICTSPADLRLSEITSSVHDTNSRTSIHPRRMHTSQIITALLDYDLDAGFVLADAVPRRLDLVGITLMDTAVIIPSGWEDLLQSSDTSIWAALADKPWIHAGPDCMLQTLADKRFRSMGLKYASTLQAPDASVRASFVTAGFGASMMLRDRAGRVNGVCIAEVEEKTCPLGLVYLRSRANDPSIEHLRAAVADTWI